MSIGRSRSRKIGGQVRVYGGQHSIAVSGCRPQFSYWVQSQSPDSFGVTTELMRAIRDWIARIASEVIREVGTGSRGGLRRACVTSISSNARLPGIQDPARHRLWSNKLVDESFTGCSIYRHTDAELSERRANLTTTCSMLEVHNTGTSRTSKRRFGLVFFCALGSISRVVAVATRSLRDSVTWPVGIG